MNEVNAIERASGLQTGERLIEPLRVTPVAPARRSRSDDDLLSARRPTTYASFVSATPASPVNCSTTSSAILWARRRDWAAGASNFRDAIRRCSGDVRS